VTLSADARAVLDAWFGAPGSDAYGRQHAWWFIKRDDTDAQLRTQFAPLVERALVGEMRDWENSPRAALARLLLLDQFPRNLFRNTPGAFAGDMMALAAAKRLVAAGDDQALIPVERIFAYLPFEHAEDLDEQRMSLQLFRALADEHAGFDGTLAYAERHHAVIARFGRFPHRNRILNRASTPEELDFLAQPGSGF